MACCPSSAGGTPPLGMLAMPQPLLVTGLNVLPAKPLSELAQGRGPRSPQPGLLLRATPAAAVCTDLPQMGSSYFLSSERGWGPQCPAKSMRQRRQESRSRGLRWGGEGPGAGVGLRAGPGTRARGTRGLSKKGTAQPLAHPEWTTADGVTGPGWPGRAPAEPHRLGGAQEDWAESRPGSLMVTWPRSTARGCKEGPWARGPLRLDPGHTPVPSPSARSCPLCAEHRGRAGTLHARPQGWGHRDPLKSRETTGQDPFLGGSECSEQERGWC